MATIQLVTLPGVTLEPNDEKRKPVQLARVVKKLVDDLPALVAMRCTELGLDPFTANDECLIDVEHRVSGYSSNPADLRVIGMFKDEQPTTGERAKIDRVWNDIMTDWFWDVAHCYKPDIIDFKLIFGC